ncbi:MAG TPA: indole-3-glycerol-phosphate synthase TrpC, partial [Eubacterium sp.]|nr:indole-3-glycerol-phosphate synthase TrpC [Eubacterium sp.]
MSILDEIAGYAKLRVEENKKSCSLDELKKRCEYIEKSGELAFEKALGKKELSYILECKKASPSKGI